MAGKRAAWEVHGDLVYAAGCARKADDRRRAHLAAQQLYAIGDPLRAFHEKEVDRADARARHWSRRIDRLTEELQELYKSRELVR